MFKVRKKNHKNFQGKMISTNTLQGKNFVVLNLTRDLRVTDENLKLSPYVPKENEKVDPGLKRITIETEIKCNHTVYYHLCPCSAAQNSFQYKHSDSPSPHSRADLLRRENKMICFHN